jgi:CRP-like cAMP-binding protein
MNVGPGITAEFPILTDEQVASVAQRGTRHHTTAGEVLYAAGDRGYDFIVIEAGRSTSCDRRCRTPPRP